MMTTKTQLKTLNSLPSNPEAERNLIGLALIEKEIPLAAKILATTDFYDPFHRGIWSAFLELEMDSQPIEAVNAWSVFKRNNPESLQAMSELAAMLHGLPETNEKVYVDAVRSASVRRFVIRKLFDGIGMLERGEKGAIGLLKRELDDIEYAEEVTGNFQPLSHIIEREVLPALKDLRSGKTNKISTGFPSIDKLIGGGISLSDVIIVVSHTGAGKSAFVLQLAANLAGQNIPVAFLSGEMPNRENGLRLLSQKAGFQNLNSLTHIDADNYDYLVNWAEHIKNLPIFFDAKTTDLRSLSTSLRSVVEQSGVKVLVVDYIQLLRLDRNFDRKSRTERITEVSQELKRIAMEYGIAIVEVAQLNREGSKSGMPSIHDLEASGQLEKDASLIFIIDRPDRRDTHVKLRVEKGRNAGESELCGRFEGRTLTFDFENL